ncbi:MAG: twin-arginine translocase TatA/TatE family subunit [Nitrospina sp.]|jgi:sec-independent protein translocase protein TatA|nr:twin-arginine translocase TatA/TatE family subunit [Nitrospina sp.]
MMGIGFPELMIILVIIMIIFGAGKLPEIGSAFGNSIRNFKKSMKDAEQENEELPEGSTAETAITEGESAEGGSTEGDSAEDTPPAENPVASTTETEQK